MKSSLKIITVLLLLCIVKVQAQDTTGISLKFPSDKKINIGVLVYNQVSGIEALGAIETFAYANYFSKKYNIYTVSNVENKTISTFGSVAKIVADYTIKDAPQSDILIIPGGDPMVTNDLIKDTNLINWISKEQIKDSIVLSISTAGLLLSSTHLLDGHKATTNPMVVNMMRSNRKIEIIEDSRFVRDRKFITTSLGVSVFDGVLQIIEMIDGKQVADGLAWMLAYNRNGDMTFLKKLYPFD